MRHLNIRFLLAGLLLAAGGLGGCATNPVTGKTELAIINTNQEVAIGEENYQPARQSQGGDYILEPELTAYVQNIGQRLAGVSDRPDLPYEFVVLNESVPNAWAMPGGKIAVNRGLLTELNSEAELAAVIGHEIVHAAARHGAKAMQRGMLAQGAMMVGQIALADEEYGGLAMGLSQFGLMALTQKYGRDAERESDYYGMLYMQRAGYNPEAAVDLQKTFLRLSENRQQTGWLEGLFSSHPPSAERVQNNLETAAQLGAGGEMGRASYQRAIATLIRNKPAYDAYDEGVKALSTGDTGTAARLAQQALSMEPREAKFHALYGDTLLKSGRANEAVPYYTAAISRNPDYFLPYLTRGLALRRSGQSSNALQDLQKSLRLLPTAPAYHGIGMILLENGQQQEAIQYLEAAAGSQTSAGQEARVALGRLQPERYLAARVGTTQDGYVAIQVQNSGAVAVSNVSLEIVVLTPDGTSIQSRQQATLEQSIGANEAQVVATRLGPITDSNELRRVQVKIISATAAQ